jgi:type IV fimbrial biogenesis protein FimT
MGRSEKGFTILEILVATSTLVVLTAAAFPNMSRSLRGHRVTAAVRKTAGILRVARSAAITRNQQARLTLTNSSKTLSVETAPTGSSTWTATGSAVTFDDGVTVSSPATSPIVTFTNTGTVSSSVTVTVSGGSATKSLSVGVLGNVDIS